MPFSAIGSGASVTSSGTSALVDLSSFATVAGPAAMIKLVNIGSETLAFKLVGAGGLVTLGGTGVFLLSPNEIDEIPFQSSTPYLAHIATSSGAFDWTLGERLENTK